MNTAICMLLFYNTLAIIGAKSPTNPKGERNNDEVEHPLGETPWPPGISG